MDSRSFLIVVGFMVDVVTVILSLFVMLRVMIKLSLANKLVLPLFKKA